jgi:hypothetical protein
VHDVAPERPASANANLSGEAAGVVVGKTRL